MKIAIHLDAGHTTTGNPRRLHVVLDEKADIVDVIDEGYEGRAGLTRKHGKIPLGPDFQITPREYRETLRSPARRGDR